MKIHLIPPILLLAACGGDGAAFTPALRSTQELTAEAGRLVPEGVIGIVHFNAPQAVIDKARSYAKLVQPGSEGMISLGLPLAPTGLKERDLDLSRAATIALTMGHALPIPTIILPATNAKDAAEVSDLEATVSGEFVGLGMAAAPKVGTATPKFATGLPTGDIVVRLDLEKLMQVFGPSLDQMLTPESLTASNPLLANDPNVTGMLETMISAVKSCANDAKVLDLAISFEGDSLDIDVMLTTKGQRDAESIRRAEETIELLLRLPYESPALVTAIGVDWDAMYEMILPMYERMAEQSPGDEGKQLLDLMKDSKQFYDMTTSMALVMDLGPVISGGGFIKTKEPGAIDVFRKLMAGMKDTIGEVTESKTMVAGMEFDTMTMKFDIDKLMALSGGPNTPPPTAEAKKMMESMFGESGFEMSLAEHDGLILNVFGPPEGGAVLVKAAKGSGKPSSMVIAAAKRFHSAPNVFMGMDLRRYMRQTLEMVKRGMPSEGVAIPLPEIPAGAPIILWGAGSHQGDKMDFQLHLELKNLLEFAKQFG